MEKTVFFSRTFFLPNSTSFDQNFSLLPCIGPTFLHFRMFWFSGLPQNRNPETIRLVPLFESKSFRPKMVGFHLILCFGFVFLFVSLLFTTHQWSLVTWVTWVTWEPAKLKFFWTNIPTKRTPVLGIAGSTLKSPTRDSSATPSWPFFRKCRSSAFSWVEDQAELLGFPKVEVAV